MEILWKLAVAPTSLFNSPTFRQNPKRICELSFEYEGKNENKRETLTFEGVEAYRCTYLTSCSANMFEIAYGKIVSLDSNPWFSEVEGIYIKKPTGTRKLRHLMICFDDGPCYEFICVGFRHS